MRKKRVTIIFTSALIILMAGSFAAYGEKFVPEKVVGAGAHWGNGKVYFFKGDHYVRYTAKTDLSEELMGAKSDPGYPKPIKDNWPGMIWTDIDAVVNMGNGKACFFKGNEFIQYDIAADKADHGFPLTITEQTWPGLVWTDGIDAAVNWGNGKIFFFKGGEYIRYDIASRSADHGYPKAIDGRSWPGMIWNSGIDDVINWGNGKAYFFKGYEYIRYDMEEDKADPGYPRPVNRQTWPGLANW